MVSVYYNSIKFNKLIFMTSMFFSKEIFCSCYTKHHCEVTQPFIFAEVSAPKRQKKKTDNIPESDVVTSDRMSPATEHAIQVAAAKPDRDVAKSTISESQATDTPLEKEPEQTRAVNAQTGKPESLTAMAASASDRGVTVANLKPTTVTDSGLEAKSEPRTAVSKEQSDRDVAKSTISESKATGTPLEKEPEQTRAVNAQTGEPESLTAIAASASDRGVAKPTTVAEAESRAASSPVSKDPPKADKCEPAKKDSRIEVQQESEIAARGLSNPGRAKLDFNFETRSGRGLKEAFPGTIAEVFEHAILDEADEDSPNTLYAGMQCIGNDYIYLCTAQMAASDHDCGNQTACAHEYPNKAPVYQHLYLSKVDIDTFLRQSVIGKVICHPPLIYFA
jgi:hypothetical protein